MFVIAGLQCNSVEIKKAFIDFIPLDVKIAEITRVEMTNKLRRDGPNLEHCRGQSYDKQQ
jgi:hypothetical protein